MKVAVVGSGAMGRNHLRVYRELVGDALVAVADADASSAGRAGEKWSIRHYEDHRNLLAKEAPDAVSVCVPTKMHHEVVMDCLEAGTHVLVEKPIASTLEQATAMVKKARERGLILTVGHIERFNPAVIELKRRITAGDLGRPFQVAARRIGPFPSRIRDVGVVVDLATHDLDIMRWILNSEPVRVYAETSREIHTTNEDLLTALVRFSNDAVGLLEINWLTPTKVRELAVTGERGMFRVDYLTQDLYFFENSDVESQYAVLRGGVNEGAMTRFPLVRREPLAAELECFLKAVSGEGSEAVSGDDAYEALRLALAVVESAATHEPKVLTSV